MISTAILNISNNIIAAPTGPADPYAAHFAADAANLTPTFATIFIAIFANIFAPNFPTNFNTIFPPLFNKAFATTVVSSSFINCFPISIIIFRCAFFLSAALSTGSQHPASFTSHPGRHLPFTAFLYIHFFLSLVCFFAFSNWVRNLAAFALAFAFSSPSALLASSSAFFASAAILASSASIAFNSAAAFFSSASISNRNFFSSSVSSSSSSISSSFLEAVSALMAFITSSGSSPTFLLSSLSSF